jgi:hypothetical protein
VLTNLAASVTADRISSLLTEKNLIFKECKQINIDEAAEKVNTITVIFN